MTPPPTLFPCTKNIAADQNQFWYLPHKSRIIKSHIIPKNDKVVTEFISIINKMQNLIGCNESYFRDSPTLLVTMRVLQRMRLFMSRRHKDWDRTVPTLLYDELWDLYFYNLQFLVLAEVKMLLLLSISFSQNYCSDFQSNGL